MNGSIECKKVNQVWVRNIFNVIYVSMECFNGNSFMIVSEGLSWENKVVDSNLGRLYMFTCCQWTDERKDRLITLPCPWIWCPWIDTWSISSRTQPGRPLEARIPYQAHVFLTTAEASDVYNHTKFNCNLFEKSKSVGLQFFDKDFWLESP